MSRQFRPTAGTGKCPVCDRPVFADSAYVGGKGYVSLVRCEGTRQFTTAADGVMDKKCDFSEPLEGRGNVPTR
jgi:hypothetical protein